MTAADLQTRLLKLFSHIYHETPPEEIPTLTRLNAERWDSMAQLKLIISLEEEFKIVIDAEEAASITSFSSAAALLEEKQPC